MDRLHCYFIFITLYSLNMTKCNKLIYYVRNLVYLTFTTLYFENHYFSVLI